MPAGLEFSQPVGVGGSLPAICDSSSQVPQGHPHRVPAFGSASGAQANSAAGGEGGRGFTRPSELQVVPSSQGAGGRSAPTSGSNSRSHSNVSHRSGMPLQYYSGAGDAGYSPVRSSKRSASPRTGPSANAAEGQDDPPVAASAVASVSDGVGSAAAGAGRFGFPSLSVLVEVVPLPMDRTLMSHKPRCDAT